MTDSTSGLSPLPRGQGRAESPDLLIPASAAPAACPVPWRPGAAQNPPGHHKLGVAERGLLCPAGHSFHLYSPEAISGTEGEKQTLRRPRRWAAFQTNGENAKPEFQPKGSHFGVAVPDPFNPLWTRETDHHGGQTRGGGGEGAAHSTLGAKDRLPLPGSRLRLPSFPSLREMSTKHWGAGW